MNQNPEQRARDSIDVLLSEAGWLVQDQSQLNLSADRGVILRECRTDSGPAEEANPAESEWRGRETVPVVYNSGMPPATPDVRTLRVPSSSPKKMSNHQEDS
ncbi:MAG: hypothetical protein ACOYM2_09135, partial [Rectinemataceae bacterium]